MYQKICPQCDKEFQTKHKHTKCCSLKCNGILKRTHSFEKICLFCNSIYSSKHKLQKYCGAECQGKANIKLTHSNCTNCNKQILKRKSKDRSGAECKNIFCDRNCYSEFNKKQIVILKCDKCGVNIKRNASQKIGNSIFCSDECRSNRDDVLSCSVCSVEFCSIVYRKSENSNGFVIVRPKRNTCSDKCLREFYRTDIIRKEKISIYMSGENHPNYVNGSSKNGRVRKTDLKENFSNRDKDAILKVFNGSCFKCGAQNDLTIDHNVPFAKGGRLVRSNTVVLCRSCNSKKNAKMPNEFYSNQEINKLSELGITQNNLFNFGF